LRQSGTLDAARAHQAREAGSIPGPVIPKTENDSRSTLIGWLRIARQSFKRSLAINLPPVQHSPQK